MKQSSLDSYLAEQRSEGAFDSDGSFSLSKGSAAQKLGKYTLPGPYSWVLKVVQAAVSWGASELRLTQVPEHSSFHFSVGPDQRYPDQRELMETMLSFDLGGEEPLKRLALALRALVQQSGFSFVIAVHTHDGEHYCLYSGECASGLTVSARAKWAELPTPGVRITVSHGQLKNFLQRLPIIGDLFSNGQRHDVSITQELVAKTFCSPIPLEIDGRRVDNFWSNPRFDNKSKTLLVAGETTDLPDHPELPMPDSAVLQSFLAGVQAPPYSSWFVIRAGDPPDRGSLSRHQVERGPAVDKPAGWVFWINDGVVVEDHPLLRRSPSWMSRVFLFLNAKGLRTDLTGFALYHGKERVARANRGLVETARLLSNERAALDVRVREHRSRERGFGQAEFEDSLLCHDIRRMIEVFELGTR